MIEAVRVFDYKIKVDIPDFFGDLTSCTIVWLKQFTETIFEASLRWNDEGYIMWLLRLNPNKTFTPICSTLSFDDKEFNLIKLAEKLHMNGIEIRERIIKERINGFTTNTNA